MQDDETRKEKTVLPTLDSKRSYTLEAVQVLYVFCSDPVEKFAARYNLSAEVVARYIQEGKWNELRAQHTERAMEILKTSTLFQVEDSLDLEIKIQAVRNMILEDQLKEILAYREKYGDFWARNPRDQEVLRDAFGFPIPIKVPQALKSAHDLISHLEVRLSALSEDAKAKEEARRLEQAKTIDAADYRYLFEKSDGSKR